MPTPIYNFEIDLADHDRGVYETLALRVARHPSESEEYLWTRVLAYALECTEGIQFSPGGLSDPDEPAITVRDRTGTIRSWIEIGTPDAARLHRASKATPRVAVYLHKDPTQFLARLAPGGFIAPTRSRSTRWTAASSASCRSTSTGGLPSASRCRIVSCTSRLAASS